MSQTNRWGTTDPIEADAGPTTDRTVRTVTASDSPEVTALASIAAAISGGRVKVDPIVGQTGVAAGGGATLF